MAIDTKHRARLDILNHIASFSLVVCYGEHDIYTPSPGNRFFPTENPSIGGLVAIHSAPISKWYLSWVVAVEERSREGWRHFVLESIEDGEKCRWHNISLVELNRETVDKYPHWRWTDRQFQFNDRWMRACYKTRDAFVHRPLQASFGDGSAVTLRIYNRVTQATIGERQWPDWRKVRIADMLEFYDEIDQTSRRRRTNV